MPWVLGWYESMAGRWVVPDPEKHKGRLLKLEVVPTFSFDKPGVISGVDTVIMEGWGIFPGLPTDTIIVGSDDGVRLFSGPFKIVDEWYGRGYTERKYSVSLLTSPVVGIWRIQYFNFGGYGRVKLSRALP